MSATPSVAIVDPRPPVPVQTLTAQAINLQSRDEADFYREAQQRYTADNRFTIASDMRSLDRLIFYETLSFRWTTQLASGRDYDDTILTPQEEDTLRKNLRETAPLISSIQNDLGLTKAAREKENMDSPAAYINRLKLAAKEHGVRREKQLGKALELTKELFSLAGAYHRASESERRKLEIENADVIVEWVLDVMKPQFDEIDEYFREHQQKFWLRTI